MSTEDIVVGWKQMDALGKVIPPPPDSDAGIRKAYKHRHYEKSKQAKQAFRPAKKARIDMQSTPSSSSLVASELTFNQSQTFPTSTPISVAGEPSHERSVPLPVTLTGVNNASVVRQHSLDLHRNENRVEVTPFIHGAEINRTLVGSVLLTPLHRQPDLPDGQQTRENWQNHQTDTNQPRLITYEDMEHAAPVSPELRIDVDVAISDPAATEIVEAPVAGGMSSPARSNLGGTASSGLVARGVETLSLKHAAELKALNDVNDLAATINGEPENEARPKARSARRMYSKANTRRRIDFVTSVKGYEVSDNAEVVEWQGGLKTVVPFIPNAHDPTKNSIPRDAESVKSFAIRPPSTESPFIKHIDCRDKSRKQKSISSECQSHLAKGVTVVLNHYEDVTERDDFMTYINTRKLSLDLMQYMEDIELRHIDSENSERDGTIASFLDKVTDHSSILWIHNIYAQQPYIPPILECLDDGFQHEYVDVLKLFKGRNPDIRDMRSWDQAYHAGVFTFEHHDAEGLLTYLRIEVGCKMVGIIEPEGYRNAKSRAHLNMLQSQFVRGKAHSSWMLDWERLGGQAYTIEVQPGDLVIMPPGTWHQVYTPIRTVATGGHFLMYDTLHLTEMACACDKKHGRIAKTDLHAYVYFNLCGMLVAIFRRDTPIFSSKTIHALCCMVLNHDEYTPNMTNKNLAKLVRREGAEDRICILARMLAKKIVKFQGWDMQDEEFLFQGPGQWMDPGKKIDLTGVVTMFDNTELRRCGSERFPYATIDEMLVEGWQRVEPEKLTRNTEGEEASISQTSYHITPVQVAPSPLETGRYPPKYRKFDSGPAREGIDGVPREQNRQ